MVRNDQMIEHSKRSNGRTFETIKWSARSFARRSPKRSQTLANSTAVHSSKYVEYLHGVEEVLDVGTRTNLVCEIVELVERPVGRLDHIILNICPGNGKRIERDKFSFSSALASRSKFAKIIEFASCQH